MGKDIVCCPVCNSIKKTLINTEGGRIWYKCTSCDNEFFELIEFDFTNNQIRKAKVTNKIAPLNIDYENWLVARVPFSEKEDKLFQAYDLILKIGTAAQIMEASEVLERIYLELE